MSQHLAHAQKPNVDYSFGDSVNFKIINNGKVLTNDMLFRHPDFYKKNKTPFFLVNGNKAECIAYYNQEEFKEITVLQPKEAISSYGKKGRNGVVLVTLKNEVKTPYIEILTNKLYYKCKTENNLSDTTSEYFEKVKGKNCAVLNLTDTNSIQTIYKNFDNEILIKHLGAGWDRTMIYITNGSLKVEGRKRIIRVTKEGFAFLTISICPLQGDCIKTVYKLKIAELPKWIEE